MAKKVIGTIYNVTKTLVKIGVFGYLFGAGLSAGAGAVGSILMAGFETGVAVSKKIHIEDGSEDDEETENDESDETQEATEE